MHIRRAIETDIPHMVAIAETKRVEYEGYSTYKHSKRPFRPRAAAASPVVSA